MNSLLRVAVRILTFNHHESYLSTLALTEHEFDVVIKYKELDLAWAENNHPVPPNMTLVEFDDGVKERLKSGHYDVVVCHTLGSLMWLFFYFKPYFVFNIHIPLFFNSISIAIKSTLKKLVYQLFKLTHKTHVIADSKFKIGAWREKGDVVVLSPTAFPEIPEGQGYDTIVYVGNEIKERGEELGYPQLAPLLDKLPIRVLGNNPGIKGGILPSSYKDYQENMQKARIYLFPVPYPQGDGYNTAMLEAMSMGMPVVTVENPSSPIVDGKNGLVCKDVDELEKACQYLLDNPKEIDRMGIEAKKTINGPFSNEMFVNGWNTILDQMVKHSSQ